MPRKDPRLDNAVKSVNDAIADDTIRHMLYLERLKTQQSREILRFLDNEVIPDLKAMLQKRIDKFASGKQTTKRLEDVIKQFEDIVEKFSNINTRIQGELFDIALYEAEFNLNMLKQNVPVNVNYTMPSPSAISTAVFATPFEGRNMDQWFSSIGEDIKNKISMEVRKGYVEGQTTQQITKRIVDANIYTTARRNVEAITRTAIAHTANQARNELFKANSDVVKQVQWTSTLDGRTSPICRARDGKLYNVDDPHPTPPAHVNCRSSLVPITKSLREMGIPVDDVTPSTRASMNGQAPADITYGQWLKKQPASFQDEVLGKTKGLLFRNGDLPIDRFVNRNGNELTLEQLKKRETQAFEKAGIE